MGYPAGFINNKIRNASRPQKENKNAIWSLRSTDGSRQKYHQAARDAMATYSTMSWGKKIQRNTIAACQGRKVTIIASAATPISAPRNIALLSDRALLSSQYIPITNTARIAVRRVAPANAAAVRSNPLYC